MHEIAELPDGYLDDLLEDRAMWHAIEECKRHDFDEKKLPDTTLYKWLADLHFAPIHELHRKLKEGHG
jgi:hypothetical protein